MVCFSSSSPCSRVRSISSKHRYNNNIGTKGMTSINLLCQHIKFVIWYRLVFPIRCISRTANYNKNMMFPLLSYIYENISFRSHHVHSFSHAFLSLTFPAHHFPAAGSRPVCHRFLRGQTAAHFLRRPSGHTVSAPVIACGSLPPPLIPVRFRFPQMETGDLDFPVQGRHRSAMPPPTL